MEHQLARVHRQAYRTMPCVMCLHLALAMLTCAAAAPVRRTSIGHAIAQRLLTQKQRRGARRQRPRHASSRCSIQAAKHGGRICGCGTCQRSKCHWVRCARRTW